MEILPTPNENFPIEPLPPSTVESETTEIIETSETTEAPEAPEANLEELRAYCSLLKSVLPPTVSENDDVNTTTNAETNDTKLPSSPTSSTASDSPSFPSSLPLTPKPTYFKLCNGISKSKRKFYRAVKFIPRGTIILREKPRFTISDSQVPQFLRDQNIKRLWYAAFIFSSQPNEKFNELLSNFNRPILYQKRNTTISQLSDEFYEYYSKLISYAFDIETFKYQDECTKSGVYQIGSHFSHSCIPNCSHRFNLQTNELIIITNEDININDVLSICYLGPQPKGCPNDAWYLAVKNNYYTKYGEYCRCNVCSRSSF